MNNKDTKKLGDNLLIAARQIHNDEIVMSIDKWVESIKEVAQLLKEDSEHKIKKQEKENVFYSK
ncbi:MAG: hypothetical protein F4X82_02225 [Candidatus Spechtbacteria bacterium SB0662_bin_43]|uniref:Uncharacterized protein n=1 Tax=Candidatus Spechtbacteria bacterium SB0662_bin_43 TaxID=2604897 RepID=A0A845DLW2_9BACT|nr:hypothetical protein [Candidatus Spechtbacteria bacterium SB0662_bin_43]